MADGDHSSGNKPRYGLELADSIRCCSYSGEPLALSRHVRIRIMHDGM